MILPVLAGLVVAAGLLLRGAWDLWAQSLLHLVCALACAAWLPSRLLGGRVPLPPGRLLGWCSALALLAGLSAASSPVHALAYPDWFNLLNALWVLLAVSLVPVERRPRIDDVLRAAGWALVLLAVYQRLWQGIERPSSALVNQNVYAGTILMLAPIAVGKRDWGLLAGLLLNLWWTKSAGAWLALFGAAAWVLGAERRSAAAPRWSVPAAAAGAAVCLAVIGLKFQSPEALHRWHWWRDALAMIRDHPLTGSGPGTFAYVLPGYREEGGLATLYAHQYYLQVAAEYGLPFALLWIGGFAGFLRGEPLKRAGILAVLLHSIWDWSLSMPGNLWLFCCLCAGAGPGPEREWEVPPRARAPLAAFSAAACMVLCLGVYNLWAADRHKARARAALEGGDFASAESAAREALRRVASDAEPHLLISMARLAEASPERKAWDEIASRLEAAARLNPYRAQTWRDLSSVYLRQGDAERSREALARGSRWCRRLQREVSP